MDMPIIEKERTCFFAGHRPYRFSFTPEDQNLFYTNLAANISKAVRELFENGCDTFLCGGTIGFDVMCSEAVVELKKGQTVYAESVIELIVRPGSKVTCVSPFEVQGIADITLGKEVMNGEELAINSYCIIPRGKDGRGFKINSEKAYIMIRGDYRIG